LLVEGGKLAVIFLDASSTHDHFFGQDAVLERVHFGDGAARRGLRPGGILRVPPVGGDLF
jgi:hypothetical protein